MPGGDRDLIINTAHKVAARLAFHHPLLALTVCPLNLTSDGITRCYVFIFTQANYNTASTAGALIIDTRTHTDFFFFFGRGGDHVIYDTLSQGQDRDVFGKNSALSAYMIWCFGDGKGRV